MTRKLPRRITSEWARFFEAHARFESTETARSIVMYSENLPKLRIFRCLVGSKRPIIEIKDGWRLLMDLGERMDSLIDSMWKDLSPEFQALIEDELVTFWLRAQKRPKGL